MKKHVQKTMRPGVLGGLGGFGGMFDLSTLNLKEPVLSFRNRWSWYEINACFYDGST